MSDTLLRVRKGQTDNRKAVASYASNYIHSNDATALRLNFGLRHTQRSRSGNVGLEDVAPGLLIAAARASRFMVTD